MRFSYAHMPDYPIQESIDLIRSADELGFYACFCVDEIYHRDMWLLLAAAADKTKRIRVGPEVTHVILKEPTLIAQQLATLDELTDGRAEAVISFGNLAMLASYHMPWQGTRPLARLREAHHVMRTFLDDGKIDFEGVFYRYTGLFTTARPVQAHIPIRIGAMGGPRSFELAGEIGEGLHHAQGYSRVNNAYAVEHLRIGAERAGNPLENMDVSDWVAMAVADDPRGAREAARAVVGYYLAAWPEQQLRRHGVLPEDIRPILDALEKGEVDRAIELTPMELALRLAIVGTPEECVVRIKEDLASVGINHVVAAVVDPPLVHAFTGRKVEGLPDGKTQLRLIHERVMPELA
jgi:5,10-methylenetetrahydromethanopterin reductase